MREDLSETEKKSETVSCCVIFSFSLKPKTRSETVALFNQPEQRHKACVGVPVFRWGYLGDDVAQPLWVDKVQLLELKCRIIEVQ